jgi:hypothetical protein
MSKDKLLFARYQSRKHLNKVLREDDDEEFLNAVGKEYELIVDKAVDYLSNRTCAEAFYTGLVDLKGDIDALTEILEQRVQSAPYNEEILQSFGYDILFMEAPKANDNMHDFVELDVSVAVNICVVEPQDAPITSGTGRDTIIS